MEVPDECWTGRTKRTGIVLGMQVRMHLDRRSSKSCRKGTATVTRAVDVVAKPKKKIWGIGQFAIRDKTEDGKIRRARSKKAARRQAWPKLKL